MTRRDLVQTVEATGTLGYGEIRAVRGIGRWTAEMFLMFRLHRPDVLPVGDLGIVKTRPT